MLQRITHLDRRTTLGVAVAAISAILLVVGAVGILSALGDDPADLPDEGSLEDIVSDTIDGAAPEAEPPAAVTGPAPVRMYIPTLYIDAPVTAKGLTPDNYPEVPDRPDQVAWYPPPVSAYPGLSGNAVFSGHVDWQTHDGRPIAGVFYRLREMKIGQIIELALEDGTKLTYRVTGNVAADYDDPNIVKVMGPTDRDVLTLITCGGTWVRDSRSGVGGNYSHRIVVRAERVVGLAEAGLGS